MIVLIIFLKCQNKSLNTSTYQLIACCTMHSNAHMKCLLCLDGLIADSQFAWFILILFNIFGSDFVLFNSFF